MNHNKYITVASAVPHVSIADPYSNLESICQLCGQMQSFNVDIAVFPELSLTGYTCADLFHNAELLNSAKDALFKLVGKSRDWNMALIVGLPWAVGDALYNVAAVISQGKLHGLVPKTYIPNYSEFYEKRWFETGYNVSEKIAVTSNHSVLLDTRQLFRYKGVTFGVEICEDLWTPVPPSTFAALAGAEILFNLSATDALVGKYDYIRQLVVSQSAKNIAGYVYASAGAGESSTDVVFDGIALIADNGKVKARGDRWTDKDYFVTAVIDLETNRHDRLTKTSFTDCRRFIGMPEYTVIEMNGEEPQSPSFRNYDALPFVPENSEVADERTKEVIDIQCAGLMQRLKATCTSNIVVGISGGLDSTLALLVATLAFDRLGLDRKGIHAITMPGFGTSGRTYHNAVELIRTLKVSFREISIVPSVRLHFADIGHDENNKDVIYENSQARQRTLILMDIANQVNGFVLGTGDMSELALGWATYNGDHMSMYGVNAGVPKTLVRKLVERFISTDKPLLSKTEAGSIGEVLTDILDTPISPELIPTDTSGNIAQKTEDLVGPYELHDFFLFYTLRYGLTPSQIFNRAITTFEGIYNMEIILKWLRVFTRRFFSQQFKRSCMPDGPKVGSVSLSPRGDWRMPSDASSKAWLSEIDELAETLSAKKY